MTRVFVSSTSVDLVTHRAAVRDALMTLGLQPIMMEYFPAMDADAVEASKAKVRDGQLFIGIYAHRYGYVPKNYTKSITEMEYDWAREFKIPRRIFVVKPDYEWPSQFIDADETPLNAFKKRVGVQEVWTEFTTPETLAAKVTQSIVTDMKAIQRQQRQQRLLAFGGIGIIALLLLILIIFVSVVQPAQANQARIAALNVQATQAVIQTATAEPMNPGTFNVVIAGFGYLDSTVASTNTPAAPAAGNQIADKVNDQVAQVIQKSGVFADQRGRNSLSVGYITASDPTGRAAQAQIIAQKLNASVVIYGLVSPTSGKQIITFTPEVYISNAAQKEINDFSGDNSFGGPILLLISDPTAMAAALQPRMDALTNYLTGLSLYLAGTYQGASSAENSFNAALKAVGSTNSPDAELQTLFEVWLGNTEVRIFDTAYGAAAAAANKGQLPTAKATLAKAADQVTKALEAGQTALSLIPDYARAFGVMEAALYRQMEFMWLTALLNGQSKQLPAYDPALISLPDSASCADTPPVFTEYDKLQKVALQALLCAQNEKATTNTASVLDIDVRTDYSIGLIYYWLATSIHSADPTPLWSNMVNRMNNVVAAYKESDANRQARLRLTTAGADSLLARHLSQTSPKDGKALLNAAAFYSDALNMLQQDSELSYTAPFIASYKQQLNGVIDNATGIPQTQTALPLSQTAGAPLTLTATQFTHTPTVSPTATVSQMVTAMASPTASATATANAP